MRRVTPGAVEGVFTRATSGWIPHSPCKKVAPWEITHQEKRVGEGGCGEGQARGSLQRGRENISMQSTPLEEIRCATPWSSILGCGCRSRSASPKIWPVTPALAPLLHGGAAPQPDSSHTCTPSRLYPELYRLTTPSPPRCLLPLDRRGRGLSNSAAAMGLEEALMELHGVRAVSSSMSLLPRLS
jgi:hypothetical protein